jgi:DNA polymerase III subunit delta
MAVTYESILSDVKAKKYKPIYLFSGEEEYYIDKLVDFFENNLLSEEQKSFNQIVLYGKDVQARQIIDEAKQYPLMSDKRLIIIKEAQDFKGLKDLADYVNNPVPHTIIVFAHKHKKIDKRLAIAKAFDKHVSFESAKLYDNKMPAWILNLAKSLGLSMTEQISTVIAEYLGNDLSKVENELEKLKLFCGPGKPVTMEIIQEQIGISKDFNVFELQKALALKDRNKSFLITKFLAENSKENPIQMTSINLFNYFVKVTIASQNASESDTVLQKKLGLTSSFFLKDYRMAARNYNVEKCKSILKMIQVIDLNSKGVGRKNSEDGDLLKELVHFILF